MSLNWESMVPIFVHPTPWSIAASLLFFALTLGLLERRFSLPHREVTGPRNRWLDLCYWFFTPLVTKTITLSVLASLLAWVFGQSLEELESFRRENWSARLPLWLQVGLVLLLGDFMHYWVHRLFHEWDCLWPIHAIHHSPTELDWFSSMRMHPLNDLVTRLAQSLPLYLLGFSLEAILLSVPIVSLVVIVSHTNVPWTYGPLRWVIVSPVYHQWHHSSESEALDKNFAGMFPIWDVLFGTSYLPRGRLARRFGCKSDQPPEHLPGQLAHPFRVWKKMAEKRPMPTIPSTLVPGAEK